MVTKYRGLSALFFFLLVGYTAVGQRYEFGLGVGGLMYKGDLSPQLNPSFMRPGFQALFRYNFSMTVVGRFNFMMGTLTANGASSPDLYISKIKPNAFQTSIAEFSGLLEYNFFNYRNPKNRFIFGSPYIVGGPTVFVFSPDDVEGTRPSAIQPAAYLGFGYKQQINQYWNVGVEFGGRFAFTDYLDNVSDMELQSNMQRGNKFDSDTYTFLGLNITYTIKEVICPFDYQQADEKIK